MFHYSPSSVPKESVSLPSSPRYSSSDRQTYLSNYHQLQQQLLDAAKRGRKDLVQHLLLKCRVPVNCKDALGYTPLMWATNYNYLDICELLLNNMANVNYKNRGGFTALHLCSALGSLQSVQLLLLKHGADVNAKAAYHGNLNATCALIEYGCNVNSSNNEGNEPIHEAAKRGNTGVMIRLLNNGVSIDRINSNGWTPLHCAVSQGRVDAVRLLLLRNANREVKDCNGMTALQLAKKEGACACADLILQAQGDESPLKSTVSYERTTPRGSLSAYSEPIPGKSGDIGMAAQQFLKEAQQLEQRCAMLEKQHAMVQRNFTEIEKKYQNLQSEYDSLLRSRRQEVESAELENNRLLKILAEREEENKFLKSKCEELIAEITPLEMNFKQQRDQYIRDYIQLESKCTKYKKELQSANEKCAKWEKMYIELQDRLQKDESRGSMERNPSSNKIIVMHNTSPPTNIIEQIAHKLEWMDLSELKEIEGQLHHLLVRIGEAKLHVVQQQNENERKLTERMKKQMDQLAQSRLCKVCVEREMEIVLIPCGHACLCKECGDKLRQCPICRVTVERRLKMFQS